MVNYALRLQFFDVNDDGGLSASFGVPETALAWARLSFSRVIFGPRHLETRRAQGGSIQHFGGMENGSYALRGGLKEVLASGISSLNYRSVSLSPNLALYKRGFCLM